MAAISRRFQALTNPINKFLSNSNPKVLSASRHQYNQVSRQRYSLEASQRVPPVISFNGETIVRSPYEDLKLPETSFCEYVFGELDNFQDLSVMVSTVLLQILLQMSIHFLCIFNTPV